MGERVQPVPPTSWKKIDEVVTRFITRFYPELLNTPGPFPVQEFLELRLSKIGYDYEVVDMPTGKEAETNFKDKIIRISSVTYEALCRNDGRARFTVMHEIGHVILHDK